MEAPANLHALLLASMILVLEQQTLHTLQTLARCTHGQLLQRTRGEQLQRLTSQQTLTHCNALLTVHIHMLVAAAGVEPTCLQAVGHIVQQRIILAYQQGAANSQATFTH